MRTRGVISIYILCFSLVSARAQQNADRQITLDVVVTDKSGAPVPGLHQEDFTVLDNKQPQKILSFRAVSGRPAADDPATEIILVLDQVNIPYTRMATERDEIEKFLRRDGGALSRPTSMIFLSDAAATMADTPSHDGNALVALMNQNLAGLRVIGKSQGVYGAEERLQLSMKAMQNLTNYEASRPGRKLVVWLSPGWPFLSGPGINLSPKQEQQVFNTIVALSDGLRKARMTIYAVDPLGVLGSGILQSQHYKEFVKGVKLPRQAQFGNVGLQVLAEQSGGRILNSSNDVAAEIATCVADADAYYVLSLDSPAGDGPNEYHALDIKIDKPGVTVRTRSGYYAQPRAQ
jgi:VWFA-related protein